MNSTALARLDVPGDAFATTLSDLNGALSQFAPMVPPIDGLTAIVTDVDNLLKGVGDLITGLSEIDTLAGLLAEVLEFLSPIPIVGEVVDVIASAVEAGVDVIASVVDTAQTLNTDVIQPVVTVLNDIATGLGDIRAVVVEIGQTVPGYINTIEILNYLSGVAAPIAKVLEGTGPAQQLNDLLQDFATVQTDVGAALAAFDPAITAIGAAVAAVASVLTAISNGIGTAGADALKVVQGVLSVTQPIYDGFMRVENAITPLKWVLDALECIFNTILKPVIDFILEVTGLQALVDNVGKAIFDKLGLTPVLTQISSSTDVGAVSSNGGGVGTGKGQAAQSLWAATQTALGQYRGGNGSGTAVAVDSMIAAITGTAIAPGKVGVPPPFPPPSPRLAGNSGTPSGVATALFVPRRIPRFDAVRLAPLQRPTPRAAPRSLKATAAAAGIASAANRVDPAAWPHTAALIADIDMLVQALDTLSPEAASLQAALTGMDAALTLPGTFGQQVTILGQLLGDAVTILDFLGTVELAALQGLVAPFDQVAHDQNAALAQVSAAIPALQAAVGTLTPSVAAVIAAVPSGADIGSTLSRIEGWQTSATQLVTMVRQARLKDAAKGNANAAAIDTLAAQVEASAADLGSRVITLATQTATQAQAVAGASVRRHRLCRRPAGDLGTQPASGRQRLARRRQGGACPGHRGQHHRSAVRPSGHAGLH